MGGYYERICLHHYTCFLGEREKDRERERQRERERGLSFFEDTMNIISRMICNQWNSHCVGIFRLLKV